MPNQITANGLQVKSLQEIIDALTAAWLSIYGDDIDVSPNSPDGQMINNVAQQVADTLQLVQQVYSSMDPNQAIGVTLDQRVSVNGVKRLPGTYSTTDITVVASQALNLVGLDGATAPVGGEFIVADPSGTQWVLVNSVSIAAAGSYIYTFRAVLQGAVRSVANTITVPVTLVAGVTSVNNPTSQLTVGANAETDAALRIRRSKSVAISAVGFYNALVAALENIEGVTAVAVYENDTDSTDGDSIPSHSIWVIVGGSGAAADIAQAIYSKRSAGCGMKGDQSYDILRPNGSTFTVLWDDVVAETMYFRFTADAITGNITTTGDVHSGTAIIDSLASTTGMTAGMLVRGTAVPAGATIVTVDSPTQITISSNCTGSHSAEAITVVPFVISDLKSAIAAAFSAGVFQTINVNAMASLVQGINANILLTSVGLSTDGISYSSTVTPATKNKQFTLASGQISIL